MSGFWPVELMQGTIAMTNQADRFNIDVSDAAMFFHNEEIWGKAESLQNQQEIMNTQILIRYAIVRETLDETIARLSTSPT